MGTIAGDIFFMGIITIQSDIIHGIITSQISELLQPMSLLDLFRKKSTEP